MHNTIEFSHDLIAGKHPLVEDDIISTRAEEYLTKYFERRVTNCSTLARFLFDGNFVECSKQNGYFTFEDNFTIYTGQELHIGDVVLFMFNKLMASGGDNELLQHFIALTRNLILPIGGSNELSSEQIRGAYKGADHFTDFHLMTHVGGTGLKTAFLNQTSIHRSRNNRKCGKWSQGRIVIRFEDPVHFLKYPVIPLLLRRNNY
ncbi:hypothetical protein K9M47_01290 [Candidatus Gracilibacteria bacterium]|nr:hypothetical protein [Candidatus Gracilibacteria bacterium]MCF7898608.1 hypothetical protein [Candidatus Paceibacterota bacterium]